LKEEEKGIFLTIGSTDLRITTEGKVQVRTHEGGSTAKVESLGFSTTSTSWVDLPGLKRTELSRLKRILQYLDKNKEFLVQVANVVVSTVKH